MPMLGVEPWRDPTSGMTIRKSNAVERGYQIFWSSRGEGMGCWAGLITQKCPAAIREKMRPDTIVLNPLDYEAVKKSVMETPRRDRAREQKRFRGSGDLRGFDASKHFRDQLDRQRQEKGS